MPRSILLALLLLLPSLASASGEGELESGESGAVLGPIRGLPEDRQAQADGEQAFARSLEALERGENEQAGEGFEALFGSTGWPEAAYNAALAWYREGRYDRGLRYAEIVGEALPEQLRVRYLQGVLLQTVGRYRDAQELLQGTLARAEELGSPFHIAVAHLNLGAAARLLGDLESAVSSFGAAEELGRTQQWNGVVAAALMGRGRVFLTMGDREGADRVWEEARRLGRKSGFEAAEVDSALSLAAIAVAEGKNERASRLVDKALVKARQVEERSVRASMLMSAAELRRQGGQPEVANELLDEAEQLFAASGVEVGVGHIAQLRGAWARLDGVLDEAESLLERALEIQGRYQVPLAEATTRRHLGLLRADQGRLDEALQLVTAAVQVFATARAAELERGAQVALADVHWRRGEIAEAIGAASRGLALAELSSDRRAQGQIRAELAVLHAAAGDPDAAYGQLEQIAKPAWQRLTEHRRARVHVQLSESLRRVGRAEEALEEARRGLELSRAADDAPLLLQARQSLALALVELGRSAEAEDFLVKEGVGEGELLDSIHTRRAIERYNQGVRALEASDYDRSAEIFETLARDERIEAERRATALKSLQNVLGLQGQAREAAGRLEQAQSSYTAALAIADEREDRAGQATLHLRLAALRSAVEDPAGAGEHAELAAVLAQEAGASRLAGDAWMVLGDLRFEDDGEAASSAYSAALAAWGEEPSLLARRANVTYNLAALEARSGETAAAIERFGEARGLALQAGNEGLAARILEILEQLESGR